MSLSSYSPEIQIKTGLVSTTTYLEERPTHDCSSGTIPSSTAPSSAAKKKRHPFTGLVDTNVDAKLPKLESRDLLRSALRVLILQLPESIFQCERKDLKGFANAQYQPQPSFNIAANTYHTSSDDSFTSTDVEIESKIQAKVERLAREYKSLQAERKTTSLLTRPTAASPPSTSQNQSGAVNQQGPPE
jgi:hypothetical protein